MSLRCSCRGGAKHLSRKDRDVRRLEFSWKKGAPPLGLFLSLRSKLSPVCFLSRSSVVPAGRELLKTQVGIIFIRSFSTSSFLHL